MRQQTHKYIPTWVTQRENLQKKGWYRVCGTKHRFGILMYGGSIPIDVHHSFSSGSWVVSYGFWNGVYLETMFIAPLSFSSSLSTGYERTHYCAGPYAIQWGRTHKELDKELLSLSIQSWMFITAENPFSQYTPKYNQEYNQTLREEIHNTGNLFWEGWGIPHCSSWIPEASFLVLGIDRETALNQKKKYSQTAVVFGEIASPAIFL